MGSITAVWTDGKGNKCGSRTRTSSILGMCYLSYTNYLHLMKVTNQKPFFYNFSLASALKDEQVLYSLSNDGK